MFGSERGMEDVVHGGLNVMIYDTIINQHEQYFFWRLSKEENILANPKKEQSAHSTKLYAQVDNQLVLWKGNMEKKPLLRSLFLPGSQHMSDYSYRWSINNQRMRHIFLIGWTNMGERERQSITNLQ